MYPDDEMVMISALQHFVFCQRQCALIHLELVWQENILTVEGKLLHDRVDQPKTENRRDLRTATAIRIRSSQLGVTGVMDMLEFHRVDALQDVAGRIVAVPLPPATGYWQPFPVEYKRGKPKLHRADEVQLCAQAICLEEMLNVHITAGALFYGQPRRREDVPFDSELRALTEAAARGVLELIRSGVTPRAVFTKACESCSLFDQCQPKSAGAGKPALAWLDAQLGSMLN
jgi:CRISPR-associated exonuclease Cas4